MEKVKQTQIDLKKRFKEQLMFINSSANSYDMGIIEEARRMALALRLLLQDGPNPRTKSLVGQLGIKETTLFYDSSCPDKPGMEFVGGALFVLTGEKSAIPFLDDSPEETGYVPFNDFWNREILYTKNKKFTRAELVGYIADQDGGAHVDENLDKNYSDLSKNHSFGWKVGKGGSESVDVENVELATIRQIAHEILRTFVTGYPQKKMNIGNSGAMFPRMYIQWKKW